MAKADELKAMIGLSGTPLERMDTAPPNIPDHEMVRRIGQGSYGEVWLARNAVGTWRAVKVVYRDRFKDARPYDREFSGIQKYEPISRTNEGLVDVLQIGRNDTEGYFYYVMELADDAAGVRSQWSVVSGQKADAYIPKTLSRVIHARGRLPMDECITLGLTLNLALGHLHRSGLIHRDVKPSNIIFVNGVPKLADIGLVTDLAEAQSFVGTEGFIPPEGPNSPQADIYALGKVLYEASMGKDRQEFPEPPSGLGVDADSRALMELNAVLLRACAPKPSERYQSAEEMNADLALLHSGRSVKDKHALERRLKLTTRVAVATVAVLVLGVVPYYLAIREARHAARSEKEARQQASKSRQVARFLEEMIEGAGPSVAQGSDATLLNKILAATVQRVGTELTNQPEVEAEIRQTLGKTYAELGQYSNALTQTSLALKLGRAALGPTNETVAGSLANIGALLLELDDRPNAEKIGLEALAVRRMVFGNEHAKVATSLNNVANAQWRQGKLAEAQAAHGEALRIRRKVLPPDHPDIGQSLGNLAILFMLRADFDQAKVALREALERLIKASSEKHPDVATLRNNLAIALARTGDWEEAKALHAKTLALRKEIYPEGHRYIASSLTQLALVTTALGELDEAETELRDALAMEEKLGIGDSAFVADTLIDLGMALLKKGDLAGAEANCIRALEMRKKVLGPENSGVAECLDALALLRVAAGDWEAAERMLQDGFRMTAKEVAPDHPDLVPPLLHLSWVRRRQGDSTGAEILHARASDISRQRGVCGACAYSDAVYDLVAALRAKGGFVEAESLMLEAAAFCRAETLANTAVRRLLLQRAVQFCETWDKAEPVRGVAGKATEWKRELAAFDAAQTPKQ